MSYKELLIYKRNIEVMRNYIDLVDIFPYPIVTNRYVISRTVLRESNLEAIKNFWHPERFKKYSESFTIGKDYVILYDKEHKNVMMSSHEFEMLSNQKFIDGAKGDVIIFGLGIGLVLHPLFNDDSVNSIKIVELDKSLVDEVYPIIKEYDLQSKLSIEVNSAFDYETDKMYDTIYFDIWSNINKEAFQEMKILEQKFSKNLKPGGWMDSWCSEEESYEFE